MNYSSKSLNATIRQTKYRRALWFNNFLTTNVQFFKSSLSFFCQLLLHRTKAFCFIADQPKAAATGQACYLVVPAETETKFRNGLKKLGYSLPGLS